MIKSLRNLKPIILSLLIAVALLLHGHKADAGPRETLIVAGGCFWCVEADFEKVPGGDRGGVRVYRRHRQEPDL